MKKVLVHFIYLAASVVITLYDLKRAILPTTDQQDKKKSNDNARFRKKFVQVYPPKKP
ncbi:MAG TPA: hypothetical protein VFU29_01095 [Chitinophagaceae bacterium]|nr:hypothetical protein [Chitinophagaceae bacterium]